MAHFTCNFISYVLNRAVDVDVIIPGVTSTEAGEPGVTHKPRWKYPVLYLAWLLQRLQHLGALYLD